MNDERFGRVVYIQTSTPAARRRGLERCGVDATVVLVSRSSPSYNTAMPPPLPAPARFSNRLVPMISAVLALTVIAPPWPVLAVLRKSRRGRARACCPATSRPPPSRIASFLRAESR